MGHFTVTYEIWEDDTNMTEMTKELKTPQEALIFISKLLDELITFKVSHNSAVTA